MNSDEGGKQVLTIHYPLSTEFRYCQKLHEKPVHRMSNDKRLQRENRGR